MWISGAAKRGGQHRVGGSCDQCKDIPKGEIKHCWFSNIMVRCRWPSSSLKMMKTNNSSSRYLWLNSWRTARLSTSRAQGNLFTRSSCWGRSWELMWPLEVRWDEEDFCNFYISIYIGYSPLGLFHISNLEIRLGACYWLLTNIWLFYNHCCWDLNLLQGSRESTRSLGRCFFATRVRDTQVQSKEYQCWTITLLL